MSTQIQTPVALIIFNRPEVTRQAIAAIRAARPRQLLVIADGARADRPGEAARCAEARSALELVDWPCEVRTNFSNVNLGCKHRVASGLDWVFSQAAEAIILEDDCIPHPSFFPYCEELLARYRNDERVHMIRGTNLSRGRRFTRDSYHFSRMYNIWGWATWARAWKGYDIEMRRWPELRDTGWLQRFLPHRDAAKLVGWFFDETYAGRVDTWDYAWVLSGWIREAFAVVPENNLVTNIGFGEDATHTRSTENWLARLEASPMDFPLRHPKDIALSVRADIHEWLQVYPRPGLLTRLRARARAYLSGSRRRLHPEST